MGTVKLFAPAGYWALTPEQRADLVNGCGAGKFGGWIIPDYILGKCITPSCDIHDYMYIVGMTLDDKMEADRVFKNNALRIVACGAKSMTLLKARSALVECYYLAVKYFGGPFYWNSKNRDSEYKEVEICL
jgi:hypothetical protein